MTHSFLAKGGGGRAGGKGQAKTERLQTIFYFLKNGIQSQHTPTRMGAAEN